MQKIILSFILFVSLSSIVHANNTEEATLIIPHHKYETTPTMNVYIGDKGPFEFLIDTGASHSSIFQSLADEIGLSYKKQNSVSTLTIDSLVFKDVTESVDLYISDQKIHRKTNLKIVGPEFDETTEARGILGVAQFRNGVLENDPENAVLKLTLKVTAEPCDILDVKSKCADFAPKLLLSKFSLGSTTGDLLIDTGNSVTKSIALFKSDYSNELWAKHHHDLPDVEVQGLSNKPLKWLRTPNFSMDGKACTGEVLLRNPQDKSPVLNKHTAIVGWPILKSLPFKMDYKNEKSDLGIEDCPYDNIKTIGISRIYLADDQSHIYIEGLIEGSSADKIGIKIDDKVEKIILSNGKVITNFDKTLYEWNNQHVYAPLGSQVTYFIRRDDKLKPFTMTAEDGHLTEIE